MEREEQNQNLWDRFVKLGERIGDGDLEGSERKWMNREYAKLSKILIPELAEQAKEQRANKAKNRNEQIIKLLAIKKCSCGGELRQSRSGSKIVYCKVCNNRYTACKTKK